MATPTYTEEQWRVIAVAPNYAVSDLGRVKRISGGSGRTIGCILRPGISPLGYRKATMFINGRKKTFLISRLILTAFVGAPPTPEHVAAHGDGNPAHDVLANLRWATKSENQLDRREHGTDNRGQKHPLAKLTEADVAEIHAAKSVSISDLARRFGVRNSTVSRILCGVRWPHMHPSPPAG